jgi:hypothetical protein
MTFDLHCPGLRGDTAEIIYLVGSSLPEIRPEQERFGKILERVRQGLLDYRGTNNVPYGTKWNTAANFTKGTSGSRWGAGLAGVKLGTTIEFPYANVGDGEVNADTARAFGHDLARAIRNYLETTQ